MKYENYKAATELVKEIEKLQEIVNYYDSENVIVTVSGMNSCKRMDQVISVSILTDSDDGKRAKIFVEGLKEEAERKINKLKRDLDRL